MNIYMAAFNFSGKPYAAAQLRTSRRAMPRRDTVAQYDRVRRRRIVLGLSAAITPVDNSAIRARDVRDEISPRLPGAGGASRDVRRRTGKKKPDGRTRPALDYNHETKTQDLCPRYHGIT